MDTVTTGRYSGSTFNRLRSFMLGLCMDGDRFDQLLRSLAERPSRRATLRLLVSSILGNLVLLTVTATEAHDKLKKCKKIDDKDKRKKCVKKARKHNATHTTQPTTCATGLPRCGGDC